MTSVVKEQVETLYKEGDIVLLRNDLKNGVEYSMLNGEEKTKTLLFLEGLMIKGEVVKIHKLKETITGHVYKLEGNDYFYTDEMIEGKLVEIDEVQQLEVGDKLLITSDNKINLPKEACGKVVELIGVSIKGEIVFKYKNDVHGGVLPLYCFDGVFYNLLEFLCDLTEDEEVCSACTTEKTENGDDVVMTTAVEEVVGTKVVLGEGEEVVKVTAEKVEPVVFVPEENYSNGIIPYLIKVDKVVYSAPATIMFYRTGAFNENGEFFIPEDSKQKKVVAKAGHGDEYDPKTGFEICMYKMFNRESAKRLKKYFKKTKKVENE